MSGLMPYGPLAYQGTIAVPYIVRDSAPTTKDFNFNVPTIWINPVDNFAWMLTSKPQNVADWLPFISGGGDITFLQGNTGGPVAPASNGILMVVGDETTATIAGDPATHTLTVSAIGGGSSVTIAGDVGSITGNSLTIYSNNPTNGATLLFTNSGTTSTLQVTDANGNTVLGNSAGNTNTSISSGSTTALGGYCFGNSAGTQTSTAVGYATLYESVADSNNSGFGSYSMEELNGGSGNTGLGSFTMEYLQTGSNNLAAGFTAGSNYAGAESNNVLIAHPGVASENNAMHIGTTGSSDLQVNATYIGGVIGATQPASGNLVGTWNSGTEQVTTVPDGTSGQFLTTNGSGSLSWASGAVEYSPAYRVVSPVVGLGGYTTIGAAIAAANSNDVIFIKEGTYTEDLVIPAATSLYFFGCGSPTIVGNISEGGDGAGASFYNLNFQTNSNYIASLSTASTFNFIDCFFTGSNNNLFTMSDGDANLYFYLCGGSAAPTYSLFDISNGDIWFYYCNWDVGGSPAAGTMTAGGILAFGTTINNSITMSGGSGAFISCQWGVGDANVTLLTTSGTASAVIHQCSLTGGTSSVLSIGAGTSVYAANNTVNSTNTNVFTGAGTVYTGGNVCIQSSGNNVTTINTLTVI